MSSAAKSKAIVGIVYLHLEPGEQGAGRCGWVEVDVGRAVFCCAGQRRGAMHRRRREQRLAAILAEAPCGRWKQAVQACQSGPKMGASHAIGHILGPAFDVPHGYTSCVALPGVLRWNAQEQHCVGRQQLVVDAFARAAQGVGASPSAAECVAGLVAELGLPGSLQAVGVRHSQLEDCAQRTMHDPLVHTNPRKINDWRDVFSILELCGPYAPELAPPAAQAAMAAL